MPKQRLSVSERACLQGSVAARRLCLFPFLYYPLQWQHDSSNQHIRPGRPRVFDRNEALKAALRVFWQRGYAPASVAELCKAMGSNAPCLYAAFGSKAGLFLEALHFYEDSYWDEPAQRLLAEPNLFRALVNFFTEAARILLGPDSPCGCMVVLAASNVGDDAAPVMDEVHKLRLATCNLFAERLRRAV